MEEQSDLTSPVEDPTNTGARLLCWGHQEYSRETAVSAPRAHGPVGETEEYMDHYDGVALGYKSAEEGARCSISCL